jgi:hypothetical protein
MLVNKTLFVPTFTATKVKISNLYDICTASSKSVDGYTRIYALDIRDGSANLWNSKNGGKSKYIEMDGIKITGLSKAQGHQRKDGKETLLAAFELLKDDHNKLSAIQDSRARYIEGINAIEISANGPSNSEIKIMPGEDMIIYWMER